jgi:predicted dehydrogenase
MANTTSCNTGRKVNVVVVGLGFIGLTHLKSYQQIESAVIFGVCSQKRLPVEGVLPGISGNLAGADAVILDRSVKAYRDLNEVLVDPEVDLVDICVPTTLHHAYAIAALNAGKHVICEKPLARTSALAREIVDAARAAKGFCMPAMCLRFWPEWAWLKEAVERKTYGRVLAARFRRVSELPAWSCEHYSDGKRSGGALLDLHIHDTDFVQFLFGKPLNIFSTGLSRFTGAIDHVVTQYQVAGGAVVHAEGSWLMAKGHGFSMAYNVNFEGATAHYELAGSTGKLCLFENGQMPQTIKCENPDGYVCELRYMIECILENRRPALVTMEDGLSAIKICEAEEESVRTGQPMPISPP